MSTTVDLINVDRAMNRPNRAVEMIGEMATDAAMRGVLAHIPRDSGDTARSHEPREVVGRPGHHEWAIDADENAERILNGTGVYGPSGRPITPETAQALRFEWKGEWVIFKGDLETPQERAIFARWAEERGMTPYFTWPKGMEARNYAEEAIGDVQRELPGIAAVACSFARRGA